MSDELDSENTVEASDAMQLSSTEVRILGCLIEKQASHPETYPLTLNALVLACNQKTSREPVMNLTPGQVGQSLRALESLQLTRLVMGSRADRWEQRVDKTLELVPAQLILTGLLLLRGPQTVNELLTRSNRMHDFEDADAVVHQLDRLIGRGLAVLIPKQAGQREDRYLHALGDPADRETILAARAHPTERNSSASPGSSALAERVEALEARIAALEERLALLEG
ncbi:YceH family protein [Pseudomonas sp. AK106]